MITVGVKALRSDGSSSSYMDRVQRKVRSFFSLPNGWYFGEGGAAHPTAAEVALSLAAKIGGAADYVDAYPDCDGGVLIAAHRGDKSVEALCKSTSLVDVILEQADEVVREENSLTLDRAVELIGGLGWPIKKSFDFYIRNITIAINSDLLASHSRIPLREAVYLSSVPSVSIGPGEGYASTFENTTRQTYQVTPRFSGACA